MEGGAGWAMAFLGLSLLRGGVPPILLLSAAPSHRLPSPSRVGWSEAVWGKAE